MEGGAGRAPKQWGAGDGAEQGGEPGVESAEQVMTEHGAGAVAAGCGSPDAQQAVEVRETCDEWPLLEEGETTAEQQVVGGSETPNEQQAVEESKTPDEQGVVDCPVGGGVEWGIESA